jgi:DNA-binding response OmpR family regulator
MEAIGLLASGIAHDFNNLLTVMNGCSEMLFSKSQVPPEARECLEMIRDCGERAATLIRRLLTFGRQQPQEPKAISLNEVVTDLSGLLRRLLPENIEFTTRLEAHSGTVAADPSLIQHALMNLAINARDAMPEGGRLEIGTSSLKLGASISESHLHMPPGNYVVLTVNDTGVGMDEVTQEHLFEPFFTTKPVGMGTGLGLSTVYGIVKQSGGRISVYSEKGKGTGFKIYLPYAEGERTEINVAQRESPEGGHETILVVEDNAEVRQFMSTVLEGLGYTILEAASGEEAALISQTHLGGIDLLIADVVLPDSTGNDIARQLTETRPGVAVLFISGYTQSFAVQERTLEPEVDFLEKPFSGDELAMRIREILRKPRRTRILIVDDDPALARFASQVLGDAGYEILVANNGNDALSIIDNQRVDLMITDLVMPEKEGLEMIVALRKSKSRLPIIAVSGVFVGDLLKTARALGAQATIEKPFSVATLLEVVQRVLRTAHS